MTPDEARGALFLHLPRELSPTERMEALLADFMRPEPIHDPGLERTLKAINRELAKREPF